MISQTVINPDVLFANTDKQSVFITGSEAVKEAIKRANIDIAIAYPITPQSESMHLVGDLYAQKYIREYFRGENELAVMSEVAGASMGGVRVFTATGGPGTLRAFEMFSTWAGARLPIVCAFMTRGVNSPLTIQPDTIEMAYMLDTGIIMLHAENSQDIYNMLLRAFVVAEMTDVHIPVGVFSDGFFVTHTREKVLIDPEDVKLPPYNPYSAPVPVIDMENVPVRLMRDPFVMKSNFISYATHASWQQEIMAAAERSRRHLNKYLGDLIEVYHGGAPTMLMASGTAVSIGREAIDRARGEGIDVGLIKIKCLRPFPAHEINSALETTKTLIIPEFNRVGWLFREVKSVLKRDINVIGAPRVFGGMTMPTELIMDEIRRSHNV
ncbi:MAG TPA: ferredoxin oxidoreductase [Acidobacteriota bacterium]|nr:ferredoxin oxidoreductase [Acidobacteriota bacterium]